MSNAQQIKISYRELMGDYRVHSRTELFEYARNKAPGGTYYTDGMLTGALKTLVSDEIEYECVSRGSYQKRARTITDQGSHMDNVIAEYKRILENALSDLEGKVQVNPFAMLDLTEGDKEELRKIHHCIEVIRNTIQDHS